MGRRDSRNVVEAFEHPDTKRIWEQLKRIADALETLVALSLPEPPAPETATCLHPEEDRVSFGMTDGQEDWQCRRCLYRSIPT